MSEYYLYTNQPNTIHPKARVYFKEFFFATKNRFKNRLVRVYLPSTYEDENSSHRFKVIYMLDGKNLFDDYTSFVGEWGIDESIEQMIEEKVNDGYIVVGIDAPEDGIDRSLEMSPYGVARASRYKLKDEGYAELLSEFIFKTVKPDIDSHFHTIPDYTGVGGSSMGGLMALILALNYQKEIKFCLSFSPAIFLFKWDNFKKYLDERLSTDLPKIFFYIGGNGFERVFVENTLRVYNYLMDHKFGHEHIKIIYDSDKEHNENAWRQYFPIMLERIDL